MFKRSNQEREKLREILIEIKNNFEIVQELPPAEGRDLKKAGMARFGISLKLPSCGLGQAVFKKYQ